MFGHRGPDWVVVLRIKVLSQSAGSRVPTKCIWGELKQTEILKRDVGGIRGGSVV